MEWSITDVQGLAIVDRELGPHRFHPAEYELVRRVIYATGDFDYGAVLGFAEGAMLAGAAALAARTAIIVDVPMVMTGILPAVQARFFNPVLCAAAVPPQNQDPRSPIAQGIAALANQYPEGIFVIGQSITALNVLIELIEAEEIQPALVIAAAAGFVDVDVAKERLQDSMIANIRVSGRKGGVGAAVTLLNGLVDLAAVAYPAS
ncbi:precorrin-8X methylmutase [Spirulina sp. CCNP1310]|uniref:precorrin-8X methylmutase n=1 Tax=Spirulina sp. CCNP1310 TaxID=3110249 RepID=UPI002B214523|nr:precorrin-8X methylmutase [Spirulina sp. CCNP1310]MEA5419854.1 precorrin-8X methylmutase [Spirulina sp. CCNP1310]